MTNRPKIHVTAEPAKLVDAMTAAVQVGNAPPFYLHSQYDPIQEAQEWLRSIEISNRTLYVVLGFGLGYHITALLSVIDAESRIVVIEPFQEKSLAHLAQSIHRDISWMNDTRVELRFHKEKRDAYVSLAQAMISSHIYKTTICPHFPSMQIYPAYYKMLLQDIGFEINQAFKIKMDCHLTNTAFLYENAWKNIYHIATSSGIQAFSQKWKGVPAIIVGSGPSLKKNAELLNQCKDQALVIACGSALKALHAHGVTPHIFASADPFPENAALQEVFSPDTLLLASYDVSHHVVGSYPGSKVFARTEGHNHLGPLQHLLPETDFLRKSVSVTTMAVDFARYAGCNPIIFVGQDLAYAADNSRYDNGVRQVFVDNPDDFTEVEGADGSKLITPIDLRDILLYLQSYINFYPETTYINATEGGALISGALHIPLREVMLKYFTGRDFVMDIHNLDGLDSEGRNLLRSELESRRQQINEMLEGLTENALQLETFVEQARHFSANELIQTVLDPIIMSVRFRTLENTGDADQDMQALSKRTLFWLTALAAIIQETVDHLEGSLINLGDERNHESCKL